MKYSRLMLPLLIIIALLLGISPGFASEAPPPDLVLDKSPVLTGEITVDAKAIEAPRPYIYRAIEGVVMIPLRAVAEALGMSVEWISEEKSVIIDGTMQIWIDKPYYTQDQKTPTEFGPAPELFNECTYVPLPFFGYAISGYNSYISDGIVTIITIAEELPV